MAFFQLKYSSLFKLCIKHERLLFNHISEQKLENTTRSRVHSKMW